MAGREYAPRKGVKGVYEKVATTFLHAGEEKKVDALRTRVGEINKLRDEYHGLSDEDLKRKTQEFRNRLQGGDDADGTIVEPERLDNILNEAFATVREVVRRKLSVRDPETNEITKEIEPYDEQMMAGIAMLQGKVAEMATGEGKTIAALFPAYLRALETTELKDGSGRKRGNVHVVTANDYLVQRDAESMRPVYEGLGLTVGINLPGMSKGAKKEAYNADVTYTTANELGFDYLRDNNGVFVKEEQVQRGFNFAVVDEADAVLIDEARKPLILSGPPISPDRDTLTNFSRIVHDMALDQQGNPEDPYYEIDLKKGTVMLTDKGDEYVHGRLRFGEETINEDNLYIYPEMVRALRNAIKAQELYRRDKEYIVENNKVVVINEPTGRPMISQQFGEGMQQAIEAKESIDITDERQTLARVSLQNLFRMYRKEKPTKETGLGCMTGTALTDAWEFGKIYNLEVLPIPRHKENIRIDREDKVYRTKREKFAAIVEDIIERHQRGQPVLVGTTSVENSEVLAEMLRRRGISEEEFKVLNAKTHKQEAEIAAQAGRRGAITIATNMAGRGTDILLGGNPEALAAHDVATTSRDVATPQAREEAIAKAKKAANQEFKRVFGRDFTDPDGRDQEELFTLVDQKEWRWAYNEFFQSAYRNLYPRIYLSMYSAVYTALYPGKLEEFKISTAADAEEVIEQGGLYVLGSERHESRRIDNQLRGRAGRQGDPGETQFYVSLEDDMMVKKYGADFASTVNMQPGASGASEEISKLIRDAQADIEESNRYDRIELVKYDEDLNRHRMVIFNERQKILEENEVRHFAHEFIDEVVGRYIEEATEDSRENWKLNSLWRSLEKLHHSERLTSEFIANLGEERTQVPFEDFRGYILKAMHESYDDHMAALARELPKPPDEARWDVNEMERTMMLKEMDFVWKAHMYEMDYLLEGIGLRSSWSPNIYVPYHAEGERMIRERMEGFKEESIGFLFEMKVR